MPPNNQFQQAPPGTPYRTPPPQAASAMKHHMNRLIIPFVLVVLLLIGAGAFGYWAYTERQDYKLNVDQKVAEATQLAVAEAEKAKEAEFAEREKSPLKTYKGPAAFGSVEIKYPKTWSAFVTEQDRGGTPVDGYFHPNFVPGMKSGVSFALHLEVIEEDYTRALERFESASERGEVKVTAIRAKNVSGVTGARIDGQISKEKRGSVVLFPLRDKTLRLTTETEDFTRDFNRIILENLKFTP